MMSLHRCIENNDVMMDWLPLDARAIFQSRVDMKLQRKIESLRTIVEALEDACASMLNALKDFKSILSSPGNDGSHQQEDPRLDMAICTRFTCRQISIVFEDIVEKYQRELDIKQRVLNDVAKRGEQHDDAFYQVHITAWMVDVEVDSDRVQCVMRDIARDAGMPYSGD